MTESARMDRTGTIRPRTPTGTRIPTDIMDTTMPFRVTDGGIVIRIMTAISIMDREVTIQEGDELL